ncbi:hypothetical protein [Comamonas terrigena]|uniref:hypothetical protein n=1 Tax=Comamonas terrigena TaxID=32013 RepID=UPI0024468739|nr:hypothetical protein [Comamonas terrigena]MDH0048624.1 hypothetical protein [Comamonas terrigena]MDH0511604.1 hypothetical protein [Comamonas terrigena]MDH1090938.1 hypothetical protein [Comamonas terrigena]
MHLIDAAGHVGNQFVHEDPATNRPPTEIDAAWLNAVQNELANAIKGFGLDLAKGDQTQLRQAIANAVAGSDLKIQGFSMPEITGPAGNRLSITAIAGQITVDAASQIIWRGTRVFSVASYSAAARTFATAASKTYHLRWRPVAGFVLLDLADAVYNPSAQAETVNAFDSQPDDALIATIVTSAGNVPTVTTYDNLAIYTPKTLVDIFSNTRVVTSGDTVLLASTFTHRYARAYRGRIDWDLWIGSAAAQTVYGHPRIEFDGVKVGHGTRLHYGYSAVGYAYTINHSGHRVQTLNRGSHTVRAMFRNEVSPTATFNPGAADSPQWEQSGSSLSVTAVEVI